MEFLKKVVWFFWKLWFYLIILVVILLLSPFLIISLSTDKFYRFFFLLARIWAYAVFYGTGFRKSIITKQQFDPTKSYMLTANHTSMMDIMLMLILVKNPFVFVGKKELAKLPIFGYFYKKACILVDRSSAVSRQKTMIMAAEKLAKGLSVCIFPEGGVPNDESVILDDFKDGAFRLAIDFEIPVVPMTFIGLKKMFPFRFFAGHPGNVFIYQHPFVETKGLSQRDKPELKYQVRELILQPLLKHEKNNHS
ncbi:1-acyl-sn-glycerol-3-phosphate acyltransferase [Paenimyroides ummariense]|uniref:1-acyl-sn-glycerol-3-phosphate acyltransferase n=1 Tax=Paenimyroides ummariense TaxID=913024 RepID=A0A1I4X517_9FLAO|nr:lysophospholipid acyltransferase family protein [Paenimyroides ummariense]SFN20752.1 1-acyl-sn-glycerol-3-phosphate acyltransferase [Paenimyroides ummariense]